MDFELNEIKQIRKRSGLTQSQLAKFAGVSQSLIAKIESERIDPTYSKTVKIFDALEQKKKKNEVKAGSMIHKKIVSVSSDKKIKDVIETMKKHAISQLPVVDGGKLVGLVSESIILDSLMSKKGNTVKDIMEDAPPVVSIKTSIEVVSNLLRHFPIVVVGKSGELKGIITKSDLLKQVYS